MSRDFRATLLWQLHPRWGGKQCCWENNPNRGEFEVSRGEKCWNCAMEKCHKCVSAPQISFGGCHCRVVTVSVKGFLAMWWAKAVLKASFPHCLACCRPEQTPCQSSWESMQFYYSLKSWILLLSPHWSTPLSKAPQRSVLFLACDKRLDVRPEAQKSRYLVVCLKTKNIFQTLEINQLHFPFSLSVWPGSEWPGPWPGGRGPLSCSCVFCCPSVCVLLSSVWIILRFL